MSMCEVCLYLPSRGPGDAHKQVIQEVGAASQTEHGVGQLEREMSRLAELPRCRERERERERGREGEDV